MGGSNLALLALTALALLALAAQTEAKICWDECKGTFSDGEINFLYAIDILIYFFKDLGQVDHVNIAGCRRRSGRQGRTPRFRCRGMEGPPCTMKKGDTVDLKVDFKSGNGNDGAKEGGGGLVSSLQSWLRGWCCCGRRPGRASSEIPCFALETN